jgi:hypothetical protein
MEPNIFVPPRSLVLDPALQPRTSGLDESYVNDLKAGAEHWPAVKCIRKGDALVLVDGFHRVAAAYDLHLETISVQVLEYPADGDLYTLAFALNASHGRPLDLSDRRAYADRVLRSHPELSDREIGRRAGLAQATIGKIRHQLEDKADIQPSEQRVGRDGRNYRVEPRLASGAPQTLGEALGDLFSPAERKAHRRLVRYMEQLAEQLEQQEELIGSFETIDKGAEACRSVLGADEAKNLGERLGWSSSNILALAVSLGYRDGNPS